MSEIKLPDFKDIIHGARVYDLDESMQAAGYAMRTDLINYDEPFGEKDFKRAQRLINAVETDNPAHGQFLSGILVSFDVTLPNKVWCEFERYKFATIVTSQSTMHRITKMDMSSVCNDYVDSGIIDIMNRKIDLYNRWTADPEATKLAHKWTDEQYKRQVDQLRRRILYSAPSGLRITARVTTNYRCLRNMYKQRHNHFLEEWSSGICKWIETLPYADLLLV